MASIADQLDAYRQSLAAAQSNNDQAIARKIEQQITAGRITELPMGIGSLTLLEGHRCEAQG